MKKEYICFEWDEEKNQSNIKKHGIDLKDVEPIFEDDCRVELFDYAHSTQEEYRYIVIGFVYDILYVVYTERGEKIRLISARIATDAERKLYYECSGLLQTRNGFDR